MKRRRPSKALVWALGAAALGVGAGLAAEKTLIGRRRIRPDPHAGEPYGRIRGDRSYEVSCADGAVLVADEVGPEDSPTGGVFLHGFCLARTVWHHQYTGIDGGHRLIFYDARHHGRSRGGRAPSEVAALAADLGAVLDRSGLEQAVLIGHSMGGMSVLEYCRRNPEDLGKRVRGIVLVNTTYTDALKTVFAAELVGGVERRLRKIFERILNDPRAARVMRLRGDDLSWLITRMGGFGPGASPAQVEFIQRLLMSFPSPPLVETMRGLRRFDMEGALASIDVPTLVVAGGTDRITTVRASRHIASEIPGARMVVLEDTGHMTMLERHPKFNALVGEFLDTNLVTKRRRRRDTGRRQQTA